MRICGFLEPFHPVIQLPSPKASLNIALKSIWLTLSDGAKVTQSSVTTSLCHYDIQLDRTKRCSVTTTTLWKKVTPNWSGRNSPECRVTLMLRSSAPRESAPPSPSCSLKVKLGSMLPPCGQARFDTLLQRFNNEQIKGLGPHPLGNLPTQTESVYNLWNNTHVYEIAMD